MFSPGKVCVLAAPLLLGACVTLPAGPSVTSLPGTGKTFDQFRAEDRDCRQYATLAVGGANPGQAQTESAVKSAVVGTVVGAAAGAALGGHGSSVGAGAGAGLLFGALAGSAAANQSGYEAQRRYDNSYVQCMYAKGNRVPLGVPLRYAAPRYYVPSPAPSYYYPLPPPPAPGYDAVPLPPG